MKKYPIHNDFSFYSHLYPLINRFTLPFMNFFLSILPKHIRTNGDLSVRKIKIQALDHKKITSYLFEPKELDNNAPCLIYFHGGGFVLRAAPYHYALAKKYASGSSCKVLFVCYRLAPKYSYPVPLNDCFLSLKWLISNSRKLGIDRNRIAVGGDSAGGNLAIGVHLLARYHKISLCGQMLIYPVIDRKMNTKSMNKYVDTPMWNRKLTKKMWKYYLQDEKNIDYASPLENHSLENLSDAYIETAEFDCLNNEALLYADALKKANVRVKVYQTKGTIHGYDIVQNSRITQKSVNRRIQFLKDCFKRNELKCPYKKSHV